MSIEKIKIGSVEHELVASNIAYGTCSTAASTAEKAVTVSGNTNWVLKTGSIIIIKFSSTNTVANATLNVNSTGAKSIYYNNAAITTSTANYGGYASRPSMYVYNGSQYVFMGWSYDVDTDTKVTQTVRTTDGEFPILLRGTSAGTTTTTTTASFGTGITANPSTGVIAATRFSGNTISLGRKTGSVIGSYSIAAGLDTIASEQNSFASGNNTTASGYASHAEGYNTTASGSDSHAEGMDTTASGYYSHAEGQGTTASEEGAHSEGWNTVASGWHSHAEGSNTIASSDEQHVQGRYNIEDSNGTYAHIVGNGTSDAPSNAHTLDWEGNAWFAGNLNVQSITIGDATITYDSENKCLVVTVA